VRALLYGPPRLLPLMNIAAAAAAALAIYILKLIIINLLGLT